MFNNFFNNFDAVRCIRYAAYFATLDIVNLPLTISSGDRPSQIQAREENSVD